MAIIYRLEKGTALTHAELDNNFTEIEAALTAKADAATVNTALAGKVSKAVIVPNTETWGELGEDGFFSGELSDWVVPNNYANVVSVVHQGGKTVTFQMATSHVNDGAIYWRKRSFDNTNQTVDFDTGWVKIGADKADKDLTINTQTASYTLALTDRGGMVRMNVASANTLTVPPNSAVAFPVGTQLVISQAGAGQTTVVAGSGVTINASGAKMKLTGQWSGATLIQVSLNTWTLLGDLSV